MGRGEERMLKGHKLLVTGLTGNLGGSIVEALRGDNEVWGIARFTRQGQLEHWQARGVHTVVGDCADGTFEGLPDDFDYVIHCAANTAPATFEQGMRDNVDGTALLMAHCRKAKAFLHISTVVVYAENPDKEHWYTEQDPTGGTIGLRHYGGTKLASEGAVRAMSVYLKLPTIICRLAVQYGQYGRGGIPGGFMRAIRDDQPIPLPARQINVHMLISDEDVVRFCEPLLKAAAAPPVTVNLAGDMPVKSVDLIEHLGELMGKKPHYFFSDKLDYCTLNVDPARRMAITGPCQVDWRDGIRRMYEARKDDTEVYKASAALKAD
jgi:UDP-glucuronate 4-epimerase